MGRQTAGIHHITAFARNAQENYDFYTRVLGLRLVKKTVNFDAPEVYHFYFGNERGSPGTIMTFFPFEQGRKGVIGGGQVGVTVFAVPEGSIEFWRDRFRQRRISHDVSERWGEKYVRFSDPDGLQLELTERKEGANNAWSFAGIPADHAIKGFGGAVLYSVSPRDTARVLLDVMGLEKTGEDGEWMRFKGSSDIGNVIDLSLMPRPRGSGGYGTVHHIAWRAKDFADHDEWRTHVSLNGLQPTPIIDRSYFHAIYFREPGGILFEIATDPPGFLIDEEFAELGKSLKLPPQYEPHRATIETFLPPLEDGPEEVKPL